MADTLSTLVRQGTQLSSSASQPSSAPSPLESAVSSGSSASPDKAKMAGTPASTRASALQALRAPTDRTKDLATTQRQDTGALKDVQQKYAEDIQQLQQTGNHLAAVSKAAALRDIEEQGLNGSATPELANASYTPERGALLTKALGGDKEALASLLSGLDPGQNGWSKEEVDSMSTSGDAGKQAIKTLLNDYLQTADERLSNYAEGKLTVGEFSKEELTQLGFESTTEMAELFGLPDAAALEQLTVGQLENLVAKVKSDKFNTAEDWQSLLADPSAPKADREMAQMMLKGMGVSGVLADEAEVARIQQQVDASDQIQWPGVGSVSINDLLANKGGLITRQIKAYLGGAKDAVPPEVAAMVDKNKATFEAALKGVQSLTSEVVAVVKANQELASAGGKLSAGLTPSDWNPNSITTTSLNNKGSATDGLSKLPEPTILAVNTALKDMKGQVSQDTYNTLFKSNNPEAWAALNANPVAKQNAIDNAEPVTATQLRDAGGYARFGSPAFPISNADELNNVLSNADSWAGMLGIRLPNLGVNSVEGLVEATKNNKAGTLNTSPSIQTRIDGAIQALSDAISNTDSMEAQILKAGLAGQPVDLKTIAGGLDADSLAVRYNSMTSTGLSKHVNETEVKSLIESKANSESDKFVLDKAGVTDPESDDEWNKKSLQDLDNILGRITSTSFYKHSPKAKKVVARINKAKASKMKNTEKMSQAGYLAIDTNPEAQFVTTGSTGLNPSGPVEESGGIITGSPMYR